MDNKHTKKLDKKDRQIMEQLEKDSRQSYAKIGRAVGLKSERVEYRIKKFMESGLIIRMFAEPNLFKLGLKTYRIYLKVDNISGKEERKMKEYFMNHPKGQWFAEFQGRWDYTMRYTMKDEIELKEEFEELSERFGHFIHSKNMVITLQQSYLPLTYFTGIEGPKRSISLKREKKIETLDDMDSAIMAYLFENSRISTVELASRIRISSDAVQYRIKRLLEKNIINFFGVYYNPQIFGYTRFKVLFWLHHTTREREEELVRYAETHPNSTYLNRNIGDWEFEVDFDTKSPQEIHDIVKDLRNKFSDIIRDHTVLTILREHVPNPFGNYLPGKRTEKKK